MRFSLALLMLLASAPLCLAATIHVPANQPTIQAGIDAAVDGDTVLVAPGSYTANLTISGKGICLLSESGAAVTSLQPVSPSTDLLAYSNHVGTVNIVEGFTFSGSNGASSVWSWETGLIVVLDNVFQDNITDYGAVQVVGNAIARGNHFHNNTALDGGGLRLWTIDSSLVEHNVFTENSTTYAGGGLSIQESVNATVRYNLFVGNKAGTGGGAISVNGAFNSIVYNNTIDACTSAANLGGGIGIWASESDTFFNNVVVNCLGHGIYLDGCAGCVAAYNDSYANQPLDYSGLVGGTGSISADPEFVGEAPSEYTLEDWSPCINAGNPDSRFDDPNGSRNDMGAFPSQRVFVVNVPEDYSTIQEAIAAALEGDTVLVSPGIYQEHIDFLGKGIVVRSKLGPDSTTITMSVPGVPLATFISGENRQSVLRGFTLTGALGSDGGAVLCLNSSPVIQDNVIRENLADQGDAIYNYGGGPLIMSNLIYANGSSDGHDVIYTLFGGARISQNSIVCNNGSGIVINATGAEDSISSNIIAFNQGDGIYSHTANSSVAVFNDVYENVGGDYYGIVPGEGSISEDPLFCDTSAADFSLAEQSPCVGTGEGGVNIGALGVGCETPAPEQPEVLNIGIGDYQDSLNLTEHSPNFSWHYFDQQSRPHTRSEIEVGDDDDWSAAEMWQPPTIEGSDTLIQYAGAALADGLTYHVRVRVHNDTLWSNWLSAPFRMNSLPTSPAPFSPEDGSVVTTGRPTLVVNNASDTEGDDLHYDFEVYLDSALTLLTAYISGVNEGASQTGWTTDSLTGENLIHWWRCRASDGYENGSWCSAISFWLSAYNDVPQPFSLEYPPDTAGSPVGTLTPEFSWQLAADPDPLDSALYTLLIAVDSNFSFVNEFPEIPSPPFTVPEELTWGTRYWWKVRAQDTHGSEAWSDTTLSFRTMTLGDASGDGTANISDAVFLIQYIFGGGPAPVPLWAGDANCDGTVNITDAVYLINYIFSGGPPPCEM